MSQIIQMDSSLQLKRKSGAGQPENNAILGVIRRGGLPLESATITGGYPERFAQEASGHNNKAVHRAYARRALVKIPPLKNYERRTATPPTSVT